MYINNKIKTLQTYVDNLLQVKTFLQHKKVMYILCNAIDNDFNIIVDLPCKTDVDNNVTSITLTKDYDNINVVVYLTDKTTLTLFFGIDNYVDYGTTSLYLPIVKNTVLDVSKNTQFVFRHNNVDFSIDYTPYNVDNNKLTVYFD